MFWIYKATKSITELGILAEFLYRKGKFVIALFCTQEKENERAWVDLILEKKGYNASTYNIIVNRELAINYIFCFVLQNSFEF